MRQCPLSALLLTGVLLGACSGAKQPAPRSRATDTAPPAASALVSVDAGTPSDGVDPALEARLEELERLHDWRSTVFGSRAPNPPVAARARKIPTRGPFRTGAFARVRAYHYRHAYANGGDPDIQDPPFDPPYTKDG